MHCTEAVCHPIVSQAQASVGLFVLQHTQQPLCPCNILRAAVNTGAQASLSAAASLRKGSWATYRVRALLCYGNVLNSPTFLLPLGQKNKQMETYFAVCTSGACGVAISNLHMESPFTAFLSRVGNSEAPSRRRLFPKETESNNCKALSPHCRQSSGVHTLAIELSDRLTCDVTPWNSVILPGFL